VRLLKLVPKRNAVLLTVPHSYHTNCLNSMEQSFLEKLKVTQLLQKFPPFYGTRRFTTVSTRDRHCTL